MPIQPLQDTRPRRYFVGPHTQSRDFRGVEAFRLCLRIAACFFAGRCKQLRSMPELAIRGLRVSGNYCVGLFSELNS